jgi:hypothetical protein
MKLRDDLPRPIPAAIERLPRDRGYPVPWFVAWMDDEGHPVPRGHGTPDFRVIHPDAIQEAVTQEICWICGEPFRSRILSYAFVIGPMCAVNRVSAEPPSHVACADWSARACPFLTRPHMDRRESNVPLDAKEPAGIMLRRNPGVALVWLTKTARGLGAPEGGLLFHVGDPTQVRFYREGRKATREEVLESIESGLPTLQELADAEGPKACAAFEQQTEAAMQLLPA